MFLVYIEQRSINKENNQWIPCSSILNVKLIQKSNINCNIFRIRVKINSFLNFKFPPLIVKTTHVFRSGNWRDNEMAKVNIKMVITYFFYFTNHTYDILISSADFSLNSKYFVTCVNLLLENFFFQACFQENIQL